ncbi:MAG: hypothetical protein HYU76_05855 [Betaproteobacteria bacterium]|nr:hypothetical protein [Betaproteobacteria bacterium]
MHEDSRQDAKDAKENQSENLNRKGAMAQRVRKEFENKLLPPEDAVF